MLLTRSLGYRTLRECQDTISSSEFALWQAEYNRNPWGEMRDNWHAATITQAICSQNGDAPGYDQLIIGYEDPPQSIDDMKAVVRAARAGGFNDGDHCKS